MNTIIALPATVPGQPQVSIELNEHLVIVGANGSGKSRLGIWIEENNHTSRIVHRISAQKALTFPEYTSVRNPEEAEKELLYGRSDQHAGIGNKRASRWGNEPTTFLLNDYERLLSLLFAKDNERNQNYVAQARQVDHHQAVPESPIDKITRVWSDMMPHRILTLEGGKVLIDRGGPNQYNGREMSDGERVALYLLGQCVCAPVGSIVIVDEPELHMHRALMDKFWNKVEELCSDKTIVYITHDLDFAVTRRAARLLWVKSYDGSAWTWDFVERKTEIPEALHLEILGTRRPILFCEGERGGLDHVIYQLCYPHRHVIPRGSGEKAVEATKALNANAGLYPYQAIGLVDRDVKSQDEIQALAEHGIHILDFAEIENLLCAESLIRLVASHLEQDPDVVVDKVTQIVRDALTSELEHQATIRAEKRIRYKLSRFTKAGNNLVGLEKGLSELLDNVHVSTEHANAKSELSAGLEGGLNHMLKLYNRKSLCARISPCFELANGGYQNILLRLLNGNQAARYLAALRELLPSL